MRTRAYRPEVLNCLEDRSLLSSVPGVSADPVVLSRARFTNILGEMRFQFELYARRPDIIHLRVQLQRLASIIPYGQADGLGVTINSILFTMQRNLIHGVDKAIYVASNEVASATRADVAAGVESGQIILR
jgi:hypothetical protein